MIRLTDNLWIGTSDDEKKVSHDRITAVLNVAHDMTGTHGWADGIEYMQVGLIDGPGNPIAAYHAAVFALVTLLKRHDTLACCHTGGRAMAVALMYLHLTGGRGWDGRIELLKERVEDELPVPHEAHKEAFHKMNWRLLTAALGD